MGTEGAQDFEAAFLLQQLSKHRRLLGRAKGRRTLTGILFVVLPLGLTPVITMSLFERNRLAAAGAIAVIFLLVMAVQAVNMRMDALIELLDARGMLADVRLKADTTGP